MFWRFLIKLLVADFVVVIFFAFALMAVLAPLVLAASASKNETAQKGIAFPLIIIAGAFQIYFWGGWSAFCALLAQRYTAHPSVTADWLYWLVAFGACTAPLGFLTAKESQGAQSAGQAHGTQTGGCLYGIVALVAFIVFAFWPAGAVTPYGWFLRFLV